MIETNSEKLINLCSRVQKLALDLYRMSVGQTKLDKFMESDIQTKSLRLYTNAVDLCEKEEGLFIEVSKFGCLRTMITNLNAQLLMCFQLGMLNSDVCIDFGYQMEQLKSEIQIYYDLAKEEFDKQNPFGNFEDEEE